jgi:hypothetical protein
VIYNAGHKAKPIVLYAVCQWREFKFRRGEQKFVISKIYVTGSDVTGRGVSHMAESDVSHVPCPEVCSAHAQPEVTPYPP